MTNETDIERGLLAGIAVYLDDILQGKEGAAELAMHDNAGDYTRIANEHIPPSAFRDIMLNLIPQAVELSNRCSALDGAIGNIRSEMERVTPNPDDHAPWFSENLSGLVAAIDAAAQIADDIGE